MANRPVFIPGKDLARLVDAMPVEFAWHSGFSPVQKRRNVAALHQAAKSRGLSPLLEVSTKADSPLGQKLSAFNLRVETGAGKIPLESAYQGSKVFANGGPYTDLYQKTARDAKSAPCIRESGALTKFHYDGLDWPLAPATAFYDWLYLSALQPHRVYLQRLYEYKGFTDIEFNPKRSLSCQARSCALLVSLMKLELLDESLGCQKKFLAVLSAGQHRAQNRAEPVPASLF